MYILRYKASKCAHTLDKMTKMQLSKIKR
uniref:Uncharacterized protein n=1 Tax=Anguilla anguilla TaxID=7936 RepID=A0A0E9UWZ6_ANGAN